MQEALPIDIQAIQYLYGKNENTRSDNTTYILAPNQTYINDVKIPMFPIDLSQQYHYENAVDEKGYFVQNKIKSKVIYSIYDAGGINSFDLSLTDNAKIDLKAGAGHFNAIGDNFFLIAYGVDIHNIIVNAGEIEIKLNDLANNITIPSKGAHVTIIGFAENDQLILDESANKTLEYTGCIYPYSNVGDLDTEICFS